jgi:hypothetical protein
VSARFCGICGTALAPAVPPGEARTRLVCPACSAVHFENPAVQAGVIVELAEGPLLCLGRLEHGEKLQVAALRAIGAGATATEPDLVLYCAVSDLDAGEVSLLFRLAPGIGAGSPAAAPLPAPAWAAALLRHYVADSGRGVFRVYAARYAAGVLSIEAVPEEACRA